ncbi:amylo-alpha-1,6-glucosidase [Agaricicola taiwanensis]|uniref:Amylo-alpha-1,6-glucosidase n=1 Tax=Agaricicola taiwanensis TaxID=591372 RepID=A0A8J2YKH2_9RHOB|nr:amylo-alpha-1,6-glucosidase [Agaricicola taiwanensis]GGE48026.1 amylo-alpha-1,6-glucosidase [Agaricicola taiwanensis]
MNQVFPELETRAGGATAPLAQFFIPATASLQERRPRTLKHGDTFALFDHNGDALSGPGSPEGLFHNDTRYLSHLYLTIGGQRPILLSSTLRDDNAALTCDLTNPDFYTDDGSVGLEHDLLHIRRSRFLWKGACYERLSFRNFDVRPQRIRAEITFLADFADLFEVRGTRRERRGIHHSPKVERDRVVLAYTGLDGRRRETHLRFEPSPADLSAERALFELEIAPHETRAIFLRIGCDDAGDGTASLRRSVLGAMLEARRALRRSSSRAAAVATSNEIFNETVRRSVSDLYMLMTDTPEGLYPYAGIPWFSTVFGRDALITAMEMLWMDPQVARGVLRHLAAEQATDFDAAADAEPGKILHEVRKGEMAELGEVPFRRYYGSIDSTPLFLMLAGAYLERTGDRETLRALWPNIEAALGWIDHHGDRDGDGFVEYGRHTDEGLANQGWKDSNDSISHADGTLARGPIALVEVQAYVYGAWRAAAAIARALDKTDRALELDARAEALRQRFDAFFFDEDLGTYVIALDGDKKPCRIRSSNAGHALFSGIAFPERAERVVRTLMSPSAFTGWGIRTLARSATRYNPMSYHNGSVWPHDNAMIAAGFARYGFAADAARVFEGLFAASTYIDLRRLPELFCGFPRQRGHGPTFYPVACAPQAWAAAAPLSLIQSSLGLGFDPYAHRVTFTRPALPQFLDEVLLRQLQVGEGSLDIALRRDSAGVAVHVMQAREGATVEVIS